jgi:phosphate:Na+ symporter
MIATESITKGSFINAEAFKQNESFLDQAEVRLSRYMIGINDAELSENAKKLQSEMFHSISDFERIGDYSQNIIDQVEESRTAASAFPATP